MKFAAGSRSGLGIALVFALSQLSAAVDANEPSLAKSAVSGIDFDRDIRPILNERCAACHGPDEQQSEFRIDRSWSFLRGGESGEPAVVPHDTERSLLFRAISGTDAVYRMPPDDDPLTPNEIQQIRTWIEQGAQLPASMGSAVDSVGTDHWSFQPIRDGNVPDADGRWVINGVDAFVLQRLTDKQLAPSTRAGRVILVRRLFLNMHGLPPTCEQIDQFLGDRSDTAWADLVDRVLHSPRYGERWASHWLDIVRFGETHGFETNRERPNAWPYRDYVIDAFNSDKPYDQFVREQIAGDALGADVATGFLVAGPHDLVKSPDLNLTLTQRQDDLADIINTTGTAFLGLTIGCARCHNHKFDPLTQKDFYAIQAVFAGVNHGERTLPVSDRQMQERIALMREQATLQRQLARYIAGDPNAAAAGLPPFRPPVNARHNVDVVEPITTQKVRFHVLATNSSEPCIDELEVWSGKTNVALAENGARAACSGSLPGYEIHKLEHINDGQYGNAHSWISNEVGGGWVQIEFSEPALIDRIEWSRDREGRYQDRLAVAYRIEAANDAGEWQLVAESRDRLSVTSSDSKGFDYSLDGIPDLESNAARARIMRLEDVSRQLDVIRDPSAVYAGTFSTPEPTHRLYRGDPTAQREVVAPDAIEVLGSLELNNATTEQQRRIAFANWCTQRSNPLTARVMVNRIWQYAFGVGIVDTPSDFGANGTLPTHPELLDWLAREFMDSNWSMRHMHRLILMSATFQQDSVPRAKAREIDAGARFLWRFPPRRLAAETIRDSVLSVSGALDLRMGGPGFSAFEVDLENVRHYFPKQRYDETDWRRMIYMTRVRQEQDSVFGAFDCPDASQVVPKRSRSTTPLQALNLLNSRFMVQQSELFANRLTREAASIDDQVRMAWRLCFARSPAADEQASAIAFIQQHGLNSFCRALLNSNEFLFLP